MRAGSLRDTIEIGTFESVDDNAAGSVDTWKLFKRLRAKHTSSSSSEKIDDEAVQSIYKDEFEIRYRRDIDSDKMYVKFDGDYYSIVRAHDPKGYRKATVLVCERINEGFGER